MKNPILFTLLCVFSIFIYACSATKMVSKTNTTSQEKVEKVAENTSNTTVEKVEEKVTETIVKTTEEKATETIVETTEEKVAENTTETIAKTTEKKVATNETAKKGTEELVNVKNEVEAEAAAPRIGTEEAYAKITATYPDIDHAQELDKFLIALKTNVEAHKWGPVFGQCSPMHYKTQIMKAKISPSQYIAEILGLHNEGNNIKEGKKLGYEDLKRIKTISYDKIDFDGKIITVEGNTNLQDDTQLKINLLIEILDNQYHLTGALG